MLDRWKKWKHKNRAPLFLKACDGVVLTVCGATWESCAGMCSSTSGYEEPIGAVAADVGVGVFCPAAEEGDDSQDNPARQFLSRHQEV